METGRYHPPAMARWLSLLLLGIPVAWLARSRGGSDALVFAASALALVPLALWIKAGTEHLAERLGAALEPDYVVLGGGNAEHVKDVPRNVRIGDNRNAFRGGFRLWE